jgi:hypothetical protein
MEDAVSSEKLVPIYETWHRIPDDCNINFHRREDHKCRKLAPGSHSGDISLVRMSSSHQQRETNGRCTNSNQSHPIPTEKYYHVYVT